MPLLVLLVLFILALPFLLVVGFFHVVTTGLEHLGLAPGVVLAVFISMLLGSFINIPLGRRRFVPVQESRFFGLFKREKLQAQGISINIGGAVIPILIAFYLLLLPGVPLQQTLIAVLLVTLISNRMAKVSPQKGIAISPFIPAFFALASALLLAPSAAAPVAFISGALGVLIGADLLKIPQIQREGSGVLSIGGAGVFDGIFLIGILSALVAGWL